MAEAEVLVGPGDIVTCIGILFQKSKDISWEEALPLMKAESIRLFEEQGKDHTAPDFIWCEVTMPCGNRATYKRPEDIPLKDTPCPCGDPNHWLVRYRTFD